MLSNTSYKTGMSGATLKWIAIIAMTIDHIGAGILFRIPALMLTDTGMLAYEVCRFIGRAAFPIFCFLLIEGFEHTHDIKKYIMGLVGFAAISEIPFDLGIFGMTVDMHHQNVMLTLLICLIMLIFIRLYEQTWVSIVSVVIACAVAWLLRVDYGYGGPLLVAVMYFTKRRTKREFVIYTCIVLTILMNEWPACLAMIPIYRYNGERGNQPHKYLFYAFYPVHLMVIYTIWRCITMGMFR